MKYNIVLVACLLSASCANMHAMEERESLNIQNRRNLEANQENVPLLRADNARCDYQKAAEACVICGSAVGCLVVGCVVFNFWMQDLAQDSSSHSE